MSVRSRSHLQHPECTLSVTFTSGLNFSNLSTTSDLPPMTARCREVCPSCESPSLLALLFITVNDKYSTDYYGQSSHLQLYDPIQPHTAPYHTLLQSSHGDGLPCSINLVARNSMMLTCRPALQATCRAQLSFCINNYDKFITYAYNS